MFYITHPQSYSLENRRHTPIDIKTIQTQTETSEKQIKNIRKWIGKLTIALRNGRTEKFKRALKKGNTIKNRL